MAVNALNSEGIFMSYREDPITVPLAVNISYQQAYHEVLPHQPWKHPMLEGAQLRVIPGDDLEMGLNLPYTKQFFVWQLHIVNPDALNGNDAEL